MIMQYESSESEFYFVWNTILSCKQYNMQFFYLFTIYNVIVVPDLSNNKKPSFKTFRNN